MEVNLKFHVMLDNDVWSTDIAANLNSNEIDGVIRALDEAMTGNRPAPSGEAHIACGFPRASCPAAWF